MLIAGNKGGTVLAFDPDQAGRVMWQRQLFERQTGSGYGVLWGVASDGANVYAANGSESKTRPEVAGGMAAVAVRDGRVMWRTPAPPCLDRKPCKPTSPGAVTAIPGAAFEGSFDGQLRAYSTDDGKIMWEYNSLRDGGVVPGNVLLVFSPE